MKFPELVPAEFLMRPNRFVAIVRFKDGTQASAYVPTTGRLTSALHPGCLVWLEQVKDPRRKIQYTLRLTELEGGGYCGVQAVQANYLFAEAVAAGNLTTFEYSQIEPEVTFGESRLDFRLSDGAGVCWVEVKSVTYAEKGVGKFPDAPTSRGRKHLGELARLAKMGQRASAIFIVQREDAHVFSPFEEMDPEFASALRRIHEQGVEVHAFRCNVNTDSITIISEIDTK
jgi:sugar fermentation stimulation protein A